MGDAGLTVANFIVAVTGGIASGKSAVTALFSRHGIVIADADVAARKIVEPGQPALAEIAACFGAHLVVNGELDRQSLRLLVFDDPQARKRLEAITHPRIRQLLIKECTDADSPYAIAAIPLLAESNGKHYDWLDRILLVDVTRDLQKKRLVSRDKITEALADKMLDAQASREQRFAMAHDVICNMHDLDSLKHCVERLDRRYRQLASKAGSAKIR